MKTPKLATDDKKKQCIEVCMKFLFVNVKNSLWGEDSGGDQSGDGRTDGRRGRWRVSLGGEE